jgi:hypothetical protein
METFRIVILTRAPRLDVQRANAHKFEPAALSDKLGSFVATDVLRHTPHRERLGEPVEHKAPAPSVIRCLGSPQYQPSPLGFFGGHAPQERVVCLPDSRQCSCCRYCLMTYHILCGGGSATAFCFGSQRIGAYYFSSIAHITRRTLPCV